VVRVPGYRSRGPGYIPGATRFYWEVMGLERGPLSLVSTNEELIERKSNGSDLETEHTAVETQYILHLCGTAMFLRDLYFVTFTPT
jgi:hypothetical protein